MSAGERLQARSIAQRLAGIRAERDRRHREVDEDALRQIDEMLDSIINEPELPLAGQEPTPDADGWIAWDAKPGAVCPVPDGVRGVVRFANGLEGGPGELARWGWGTDADGKASGYCITAYRVLP